MKKLVTYILVIVSYLLINSYDSFATTKPEGAPGKSSRLAKVTSAITTGTLNFEGATSGAQTQVITVDGNFFVTTGDSHGMYHLSNSGQDEVYINYHTTSSSTTYSFTVATTGSASPSSYILSSINFESPCIYRM